MDTSILSDPLKLIQKRLESVRQYVDMTEPEFAEAINVGRATIANINRGRNNPSLDVVLRTVNRFPDINPVWLLQGEGQMLHTPHTSYSSIDQNDDLPLFAPRENTKSVGNPPTMPKESNPQASEDLCQTVKHTLSEAITTLQRPSRRITEIRIFFDDNTYEIFQPTPPTS